MKRILSIFTGLAMALTVISCGNAKHAAGLPSEKQYANRAEMIVAQIHDPQSKYVVVACHRGDWRNYPENSIPAIESVIKMGADMVEIDIHKTKDGALVLCHDKTLDRTTNGKGLISDHTLAQIKKLRLRRMHGVLTDSLRMPTLEEALRVCKDRITVNIDKGYDYYDEVLAITEKLGVTDQILIKGTKPIDVVKKDMAAHAHNMMYMPIVNAWNEAGKNLFDSYMSTGTVPLAYEVCFKEVTSVEKEWFKKIKDSGSKIWVNTIWGSLCANLDDDAADLAGDPAVIYDQVLALGTSMIQTDRPEQLLKYLRAKGRHN